MTTTEVTKAARACFSDDLRRYRRSWGLWLILLVAPIGARFLVEGSTVHISLGGHLLRMTWGTVGVTIGVVASTMLLPAGFLYLRSAVTRRRPWQVEDVAPTPRAAMVLGRFAADCAVLLSALAAATVAGWVLAWRGHHGPVDFLGLSLAAWLIAAPSIVCLVALRHLLSALPATRGALGDVIAFGCWMTMLAMPAVVADKSSSFSVNMRDPGGYVRPIVGSGALTGRDFSVGGGPIRPGRVDLDADAGLQAPGYVASRLAWLIVGLATVALAAIIDRPTKPSKLRQRSEGSWARKLKRRPATASDLPAKAAPWPVVALWTSEIKLIGRGAAFPFLAAAAALLGIVADYRHVGSPAALLLLVFALSAQAGRSEARDFVRLTSTTFTPPMVRRAAFVAAGTTWASIMALPNAISTASSTPLLLGAATGAAAAVSASLLGTISRSAFAPRMLLLMAWYGYFAAG